MSKKRAGPVEPDPRDAKIAELEKQLAELRLKSARDDATISVLATRMRGLDFQVTQLMIEREVGNK